MNPTSDAICVPLREPSSLACCDFLDRKRTTVPHVSSSHTPSSALLQSIRAALHGTNPNDRANLKGDVLHHTYISDDGAEESLAWDTTAVCWSRGGTMQRFWDFEDEGETVRWACMGKLEQSSSGSPCLNGAAFGTHAMPERSSYSSDHPSKYSSFGPFWEWRSPLRERPGQTSLLVAVYIFLRTSLRIFLLDGTDFTVSLPFTVRKAWPLWPHGVMMQRYVDKRELDEAEVTGEYLLPSLFTLTSPLVELSSVGLTKGIVGRPGSSTLVLEDETELLNHTLESVDATETVIHVGDHLSKSPETIVVTIEVETCRLSVWSYVYIPPMGIPEPLRSDQNPQSRDSNATTSELPFLRSSGTNEQMTSRGQVSASSTTSSLAAMLANIKTDFLVEGEAHGALNTSMRHDSVAAAHLGDATDHVSEFQVPEDHGRMKAACWMECLHTEDITPHDAGDWANATVRVFDDRVEDTQRRFFLAVCFPQTGLLMIFLCSTTQDKRISVALHRRMSATSIARVNCLRQDVYDLLTISREHGPTILTYGLQPMPIRFSLAQPTGNVSAASTLCKAVRLSEDARCNIIVVIQDGSRWQANLDFDNGDDLTVACFRTLSMTLTAEAFFHLKVSYVRRWQDTARVIAHKQSFECFRSALSDTLRFPIRATHQIKQDDSWSFLGYSTSRRRFVDDSSLGHLELPDRAEAQPQLPAKTRERPHALLGPALNSLHLLGEDLRQALSTEYLVYTLAPLLCDMALVIRPEWADYWKRTIPDVLDGWPCPLDTNVEHLNDTLALCPPDFTSLLHVRLYESTSQPGPHGRNLGSHWNITPSYAYGKIETLSSLAYLSRVFLTMGPSSQVENTRVRAERGLSMMLDLKPTERFDDLPTSVSAPLLEAARTMQIIPVAGWSSNAYKLTGRNDCAQASKLDEEHGSAADGYLRSGNLANTSCNLSTIGDVIKEARSSTTGELTLVTGKELDQEGFTDARFSKDRRVEEVARMLCSSDVPLVKMIEQPEASEHETLREQQSTLIRTSERTQALPYGRAMLTFGTIPSLSRESFVIPKMEYSIRLVPPNVTISPELNRIPKASIEWGEFHNGVAAGLRIIPATKGIESSWIAFNKPSELTPQHAGFLMALGLTGHLKGMLTWQTFGYLTPKHEQTSIGVLLGLSAAHVGSGDEHVTKILAVHAPALLPRREVDLNVPLITQTAAIAGVGLLYMGTKKRHMAEVLLNEIQRKDLTQPDLTNEHREAYTLAAGIGFGMVMLAKGTNTPSDNDFVERLRLLIHGQPPSGTNYLTSYDLNLTSPAATMALGLMFLRTDRPDIAEILALPDATVELHRIQPAMLLIRAFGKALIMWESIRPTPQWILDQVPPLLVEAIRKQNKEGKHADGAAELAYLNIVAGACFALALKYVGSLHSAACDCIAAHYTEYTRIVIFNGPAFEDRVRRAVVRECLNLLSVSMSIIMAGSGDLAILRKLRSAYGMYVPEPIGRYGSNTANHMALGMLFLGGGRCTFGASNVAIASMVAAFYPRFAQFSGDNKCYLQALRHLWVLAVEPRCAIARDVDTREIVPVPFRMRVGMDGLDDIMFASRTPEILSNITHIKSIKVETPRYWPSYIDMTNDLYHTLFVRNQTIWVKRRSAFLSYKDDPSGSRCLLVRSHLSTADAATLEVPEVLAVPTAGRSNLMPFISSFSSDPLFLATADRLCRETPDATEQEMIFAGYCRAALQDALFQDKLYTLQTHLNLFHTRSIRPSSRLFQLRAQHVRYCNIFYQHTYDRFFSGAKENNARPPLVRSGTTASVVRVLDGALETIRRHPLFLRALGQYARGEHVRGGSGLLPGGISINQALSWYLLCEFVPPPSILRVLRALAEQAHMNGIRELQNGAQHFGVMDEGIKLAVHRTGTLMTESIGGRWSMRSLDEIVSGWYTSDA